jgi:hypothetical protein
MKGPVVATCLAIAACGPRSPGPHQGSAAPVPDAAPVVAVPLPLERDLPRLAQLGVKLFEDIVKVFAAAGEDCSTTAQQLDALRGTYGEVSVANAKVLREGRAMELKLALRPYDDRFEAAAKAIAGSKTMHACAMDGTFARAFDGLVGPPP